jgi:hypothetical protein
MIEIDGSPIVGRLLVPDGAIALRRISRRDAYDQYIDAGGNPRFARSTVLYVDLLGIGSMARDSHALEHLVRLRPALEEAAELAETDDPEESHASTWFTDNLVVATPILGPFQDEEGALLFTFLRSSYFFLSLLGNGFLGRGGIAVGDHYMDDRFVFGPALIDAVEVEQHTGFPRIALAPATVALACDLASRSGAMRPRQVPHIQCLAHDDSGVVFVDWITTWLGEEDDDVLAQRLVALFRERIAAGMAASSARPEVSEKWQWIADYFDWAVDGHGDRFASLRVQPGPGLHRFSPLHETMEA